MADQFTPLKSSKKGVVELPGTSEQIECLRLILEAQNDMPSGPIYRDTNKQLAGLLFNNSDEEQAVFHLVESHGTTLRNVALDYILKPSCFARQKTRDQEEVDALDERLSFSSKWQNGFDGLCDRLAELPSEWSIVQLTLEWDHLSRFPPRNRDVNRGLGVYFTRFSCGELSKGKGGKPVSIHLPTLDKNKDQLSLMAAMRKNLSKMHHPSRTARSKIHDECSRGIEQIVQDLQRWVGGWQCLLLGRLVSEKLRHAIKSAVDSIVASFSLVDATVVDLEAKPYSLKQNKSEQPPIIPEKALEILYLLATVPFITSDQIFQVCSCLLKDSNFAHYLSNRIHDIVRTYNVPLQKAKRYPVVLVIDEELDILPFEIMSAVENQSFSRMPSIHLIHALYNLHKNSAMKNGVDTSKGYYVVNPTNDLPQLEACFKLVSSNLDVQKWEGIKGSPPSKDDFLKGLMEYDLFLYCGHGGGNQFLPRDSIERSFVKSIVLLFGCSSNSLDDLGGGRVEMSALAYSYLIAGSPCVVGMLWQVLDNDVNAMTSELIKLFCNSGIRSEKGDNDELDTLAVNLKKMDIAATQNETPRRDSGPVHDLAEAVAVCRKRATRTMNKAALVVRGLPISAIGSN